MPIQRRVIVVGSVNVDLVARVARLPAPGETVTGAAFERHHGGKGGNQAVAAARLGASTVFIGAVGDDALGVEARAALAGEGVEVAELASVAGPTGVALILVDARGENLIAVAAGANELLSPSDVVSAIDRLRVGSGDVIVAGNEIRTVTAAAALEEARRRGARAIFNPAPVEGLDRSILRFVDVLVPNGVELAALARGGEASDLLEGGPAGSGVAEAVVVTLGSAGAIVVQRDGAPVELPAPPVTAIDSVGAGDTFVGCLAAGLATGRTLGEAAGRAVVAASISTTRQGARGGMPTAGELERQLA